MKLICGSEKYQLGGPKESAIGLRVVAPNLPPEIEVEGYKLLLKSSFHVTLVPIGHIAAKHKVARPDFVDGIVADFCDFTRKNSVDFIRYRREFRFASQDEKRSVVAMCDVSNLKEFYEVINKKYGLSAEAPPTHVTFYTLQPDAGIFLTNADDIDSLTKIINVPFAL